MEFKVIVYIIIGILYFIYSARSKAKQVKEEPDGQKPKPVSPPASSWEDILRELQQQQKKREEQTAPKQKTSKSATASNKPTTKPKSRPQTVSSAVQKSSRSQPLTGVLTDEDKIERGNLRIENEGVYKVESIQEMEAREQQELVEGHYQFNAREALIGSIILERKYF